MSLPGHGGSSHEGDRTPACSRRRHASRFTYKNLADLAAASPTSPLRVLAHIDLDAYYAQCEMLRLGTDEDTPLVVQQWRNIIAVNYPARKFGITRMISAEKAKGMCPSLVVQHVPSWKEGEGQWAYHADSFSAMAHHKVSLEPYRIRSREILATLKESLPSTPTMAVPCKIEKAGIDEVFIDLSPYIHDLLVNKLYPDLFARYREHYQDEAATELPLAPVSDTDLDWEATSSGVIDHTDKRLDDAAAQVQEQDIDKGLLNDGGDTPLGGLAASQEHDDDHHHHGDSVDDKVVDWDDVAMLEGARVVQAMRKALFDKLRFRCSAGIASNKMLSKLGSSQHKPNKQTVVRPRAVSNFLTSLSSVTKLRGLGGKMGSRVVSAFDTESIAELLTVPLPQMQAKLNDQEAGYNIYWMIRGIDTSEVTARTEIKSIISAKSFQPPLTTMEQAMRWIRVYVAELKCRLLDEKLSLALLAAATVVAPPPTVVDPAAASVAATSGINPGDIPSDIPSNIPSDNQETPNAPNSGDVLEPTQKQTSSPAPVPIQVVPSPVTSTKQSQPRLPQTIRLHYGHGTVPGQGWKSRQTRIPRDGTPLDEDKLLRLGKQLLEQAQRTDTLWPCTHLAISVDGFEEPVKGNKSIESFFQPKTNASSAPSTSSTSFTLPSSSTVNKPPEGFVDGGDNDYDNNYKDAIHAGENNGLDAPHAGDMDTDQDTDDKNDRPLSKRRRLGLGMGMAGPHDGDERCRAETKSGEVGSSSRLFDERPTATSSSSIIDILKNTRPYSRGGIGETKGRTDSLPSVSPVSSVASFFGNHGSSAGLANHAGGSNQRLPPGIAIGDCGLQAELKGGRASERCSQCGQFFGSAVELQEHQDWHVARDLQAKERIVLTPSTATSSASTTGSHPSALPSRRRGVAAPSKRTGTPPSISSFFQHHNQTRAQSQSQSQTLSWGQSRNSTRPPGSEAAAAKHSSHPKDNAMEPGGTGIDTAADSLSCHRCGAVFAHADEAQVHQDWHFAKDLADSLG